MPVRVLTRPTFACIALSLGLAGAGAWVLADSAIRLMEEEQVGLYKLIEARLKLMREEAREDTEKEELEDALERLKDAREEVGEAFAPTRLLEDMGAAHRFRDPKIHHVVAAAAGGLALLVGVLTALASYGAWLTGWSRARLLDKTDRTVYRPNACSLLAAWFALGWGLCLAVPSVSALSELARIRDEETLTALFNMSAMLSLSEHYRFLGVLGALAAAAGAAALPAAWIGLVRASRAVEKAAAEKD